VLAAYAYAHANGADSPHAPEKADAQ
jgi:hypothetical protein